MLLLNVRRNFSSDQKVFKKFVYVSSLLPTPKEVIKQLNQLVFKFLWKGVDKVTRLSVINEYENGGLKMIDFEIMVKSLRLTWLKRILVKMMVRGRVMYVKD